jgi:drug/metabolite transporter (DMT)-like permease
MRTKLKGSIYLLLAFSFAGSSVISAKILANALGTFTITAVSLFFALVFLLPLCGRSLIRDLRCLQKPQLILIVLQAVFGIFLFRMFLINGLSHTSAFEAGILTGATPAITALLAMMFLGEQASRRTVTGIICTIVGIVMIQGISDTGDVLPFLHLGGNLLVLCAAVSESVFNVLSRVGATKLVSTRNNSQESLTNSPLTQTILVTIAALILCIFPTLFENPVKRLSEIGTTEWLTLIWYGVFVTALAFVCWYAGIKHQSAFVAAAFSGVMPFVSMALSVFLLGETSGWQPWVGGLLVIVGLIITSTTSGSTHRKNDKSSSL